jgi:hypothetical protein
VDGLADDLKGQAGLLRLDLTSKVGRAAAREYGVKVIPAILVFDGSGRIILRQSGAPEAAPIRKAVAASYAGR